MNSKSYWRLFFHHLEILVMEFLPTCCCACLVAVGVGYLIHGEWDFPTIEQPLWYKIGSMLLSFFWYIFLLSTSRALKFCTLHRWTLAFLYYSFLLIYINRWWGLGPLAKPLLLLFTFLGTLILTITVYKLIKNRLCKK